MNPVETAIRAWVEPKKRRHSKRKRGPIPWRPQPYGQRVLVFDTETTTDHAQRLLFGFFRVYKDDRFVTEGIIAADVLDYEAMAAIQEYAAKHRVPIYSRERFVEEVFYPEVYGLGTLCVGFNLPFDITRVAVSAGCGRGEHRRKFKIVLSKRLKWHDLRIEAASAKAAFIGFVPKRKLSKSEKPFFKGRFLDLSSLTRAFTGVSKTLKTASKVFGTHTRKMGLDELGNVDRRTLTYGRQDVRVTWALYRKLREEYAKHPFATFANERAKPESGLYMGALYSSASIAKQYLRLLGFRPLLERQPDFNRRHLGKGAASYFGGRAEVRVRKRDVFAAVLDYTAMYATIFVLQDLQALVERGLRAVSVPAAEMEAFVANLTPERLYDPKVWRLLNCLVLVEPQGAILPVRMRMTRDDPYTIAVTPLHTLETRWCTLADVIASVLLGNKAPTIRRAIRFVAKAPRCIREVAFRGEVPLGASEPIFKTVVEQRQRAKRGVSGDTDLVRLEMGLKQMAAAGAYGIFAEVNVTPHKAGEALSGTVYSDRSYECANVHDERPGAFSNPIIASFVTGGARLMLALLEYEVSKRGGTFAFCDTDSLAIVLKTRGFKGVPGIETHEVDEIIARFDALNPYANVKHLLKREYPNAPDLRCFAISAKRYVLYRMRPGRRVQLVKASESGLGAIIGRTRNETTGKLARRVWLAILVKELPRISARQRRRAKPLVDFDVPLRRKFPISQPSILQRLAPYNRSRSYDFRVKPYGFVQTATPAIIMGGDDLLPIAPFELDVAKAKRLPWIDFHTGKAVQLDWSGELRADSVPVMRMSEYIAQYRRHPEAKAADESGNPCGPATKGVLGRLAVRSVRLARIGKEIDRLDEDEGASLEDDGPVEFERASLADDIAFLASFPQEVTAREIGMSARRWRDLAKGRAMPRGATAESIARLAAQYRLSSSGLASVETPGIRRAKRPRRRRSARPRPNKGAPP
jgi:hypothetical protein